MNTTYKRKIVNELRKYPYGLTITGLAKNIKLSRQTISNYLSFLEGANQVTFRQVGMAKVYSILGGNK